TAYELETLLEFRRVLFRSGPDQALSAQLVLEAVEEHGGGAGPEMIGMDVDEGELTETGRIRQPVEHLGGLTRWAHPAEAQALTEIGRASCRGRGARRVTSS